MVHLEQEDVAAVDLYACLAPRLVRILEHNLRAPVWLVEDACQLAWEQFIQRQVGEGFEPDQVLSWLATTARREALMMLRRSARDQPLELVDASPGSPAARGWAADPHEAVERRDRLSGIRRLPARHQRALWMQGLGFSTAEIAAGTGSTPRAVERRLARARRRLRLADARPAGTAA